MTRAAELLLAALAVVIVLAVIAALWAALVAVA